LDVNKQETFEAAPESNVEVKNERLQEAASEDVPIPQIQQPSEIVPIQKIKKVSTF